MIDRCIEILEHFKIMPGPVTGISCGKFKFSHEHCGWRHFIIWLAIVVARCAVPIWVCEYKSGGHSERVIFPSIALAKTQLGFVLLGSSFTLGEHTM